MPVWLAAGLFDGYQTLTAKAERAKVLLETFDPVVEQALKEFNVPGLAMAVIVDGEVIYQKGFGYRDLESTLPVTSETIFRAGSLTKGFTTFLIGTLIDEGKLNWDGLVIDYLPDFRLYDQYATQNLTLRDLVTHRTGMPRHDFMWYNSKMSRSEVFRRLRHLEPSCDIRARYQYNNLMYLIAGFALEEASGKKWEELMHQRILDPLDMDHTHLCINDVVNSDNYALPYIEKEGLLKQLPLRDFSVIGPAGSINSNVEDLTKWVKLQLNQGVYENQTLISPATLQEMHTAQVISSGVPEGRDTTVNAYGLGWYVNTYRGHYYLFHDGALDGYTTIIGMLPKAGIGIVILANKNLTSLPRCLCLETFDRLLELPPIHWLEQGVDGLQKAKQTEQENKLKENSSRKKGTSPSHPLEDFVGEYEHPGYGIARVTLKEGRLVATFNGIDCLLDHWHYDVFSIAEESQDLFISWKGMKLTFRNNIEGDVDELAIPFEPQSGDIVFKKRAGDALLDLSYLKQFTGFYELYGFTGEVALKNGSLIAAIPGQPLFELVPTGINEFKVKKMAGYAIRFVMDSANRVKEVLLVLPYGAFTAVPKG
jgi:CubicO group peptidase (beta-lactamase class C family)